MSHVLDIVSGGEASTLLENEIKWLSDEEKQHLFVSGVRDCYGHQSERRPRTSNPLAQAATPLKVIIYTFHSNICNSVITYR